MSQVFRAAFAARLVEVLSTPDRTWSIEGDGRLISSDDMAVTVTDDNTPMHADVQLLLKRHQPDAPVIHDCLSGFGETEEAAARVAALIFHESTWATFREWETQRGEFANHYPGDRFGAEGWHEIVSGVVSYGVTTGSFEDLQQWLVDRAPLAGISSAIAAELEPLRVHGVKLLVGGYGDNRTAEIRIDGVPSAAASAILRDLDWKTPPDFALARCYGLFIPTEPPPD